MYYDNYVVYPITGVPENPTGSEIQSGFAAPGEESANKMLCKSDDFLTFGIIVIKEFTIFLRLAQQLM